MNQASSGIAIATRTPCAASACADDRVPDRCHCVAASAAAHHGRPGFTAAREQPFHLRLAGESDRIDATRPRASVASRSRYRSLAVASIGVAIRRKPLQHAARLRPAAGSRSVSGWDHRHTAVHRPVAPCERRRSNAVSQSRRTPVGSGISAGRSLAQPQLAQRACGFWAARDLAQPLPRAGQERRRAEPAHALRCSAAGRRRSPSPVSRIRSSQTRRRQHAADPGQHRLWDRARR